ncbi:MAG: tetratricopeptide repeat protein [Isosphaeraceae bacterium]|nr:tetratricopeptide repeat protein [Isosphaeraceae bacterium]
MRPVKRLVVVVIFGSLWLPATSRAVPPPERLQAPAAAADGVLSYVDGLDAIEAGRFADALAPLGAAIEAEEENPSYYAARGTAYLLGEKVAEGMKDLTRATRLDPNHKDARRMLSFGFRMRGDERRAAEVYPHYSNDDWDRFLLETGNSYGRLARAGDLAGRNPQYFAEVQQQRASALRRLPQIGDRFAKLQKIATPGIAPALYARAVRRVEAKDWAGAIPDLQAYLATTPDDRSARYYYALSLLGRGNLDSARHEFTSVLCWKPALVPAYLGRAEAAARLGDVARAKADLAVAAQVDPTDSARTRAAVELEVAKAAPTAGDPAPLLDALLQAARSRAPWDELVTRGLDLVKARDAKRRRGDERYQDRRRVLEFAAFDDPKNPTRHSELGQFLLDEADVRGESVEPNGDWSSYRSWTNAQKAAELNLAKSSLERALMLDREHVPALVGLAALKIRDGQWADAENILREALRIRADDPRLLELMSRVMQEAADQKQAAASELRRVKTWTEYGFNVTVFYSRYPSLAERDRAEQYDQMSANLLAQYRQYVDAAIKACGDSADGFYYRGMFAANEGDYAAARTALERAKALAPENLNVGYRLANVYAKLGMVEPATDELARAKNLETTTAGPYLQRAWSKIVNNAWKASRTALDRAKEWDAADPRIPAYLGVIAEANGRADEATACYQGALAIEEAVARLRGDTLQPGGTGLAPARVFGLTLALRLKLARLVADARPAEAVALYRANAALEPRISEWEWNRRLSAAMLPDPEADPKLIPSPPLAMAVMMQSRVLCGKSLIALRKPREALEQFAVAVDFPSRLRQGGTIYLEEWLERARLGMSEAYFYLGDRAQAHQWQMKVQGRDFKDPIEIERMRVKGLLGSTSRLRSQ